MKLRAAHQTHIGHYRSRNEDSLLSDEKQRLFAVADGIGGLPAGSEASRAAVTALADWFAHLTAPSVPDYSACMVAVNQYVFQLGRRLSPGYGIGSTLTFMHFIEDRLHVGHVGDSSLYRWREGLLERLTCEHNVANDHEMAVQISGGSRSPASPSALTRCIGQPPPLHPSVEKHEIMIGDRYLLCTDGVTRYHDASEIATILEKLSSPQKVCQQLVKNANERGGADNSTVVAVYVS